MVEYLPSKCEALISTQKNHQQEKKKKIPMYKLNQGKELKDLYNKTIKP
jgi:hypothetical protein